MKLTLKRITLYLTRIKKVNNYFMRLRSQVRGNNVKLYEVTTTLLKAEKQLRELQQTMVKQEGN